MVGDTESFKLRVVVKDCFRSIVEDKLEREKVIIGVLRGV